MYEFHHVQPPLNFSCCIYTITLQDVVFINTVSMWLTIKRSDVIIHDLCGCHHNHTMIIAKCLSMRHIIVRGGRAPTIEYVIWVCHKIQNGMKYFSLVNMTLLLCSQLAIRYVYMHAINNEIFRVKIIMIKVFLCSANGYCLMEKALNHEPNVLYSSSLKTVGCIVVIL